MSNGKKGGQPGNQNAMKHGRYSLPKRAARRAIYAAREQERREKHAEWVKTVPQTDYAAICAQIAASKRGATADDLPVRGLVH
jgi:hypothetical protein